MEYNSIGICSSGVFSRVVIILYLIQLFILSQALPEECNTWARYSMNRTSLKFGFHRDILSNLSWSLGGVLADHLECNILFIEHIPQEMFIDLDEIKSQSLIKVIPLAHTTIDVERPAHLSSHYKVLVYVDNVKRSLQNSKLEISTTTILPIHWRYQKPTQKDHYVKTSLSSPTVLGKCDGFIPEPFQHCVDQLQIFKYPCHHNILDLCQWFKLDQDQTEDDMSVYFLIPVGTQDDAMLVTFMTMLVTISASVSLIACNHDNSINRH